MSLHQTVLWQRTHSSLVIVLPVSLPMTTLSADCCACWDRIHGVIDVYRISMSLKWFAVRYIFQASVLRSFLGLSYNDDMACSSNVKCAERAGFSAGGAQCGNLFWRPSPITSSFRFPPYHLAKELLISPQPLPHIHFICFKAPVKAVFTNLLSYPLKIQICALQKAY